MVFSIESSMSKPIYHCVTSLLTLLTETSKSQKEDANCGFLHREFGVQTDISLRHVAF